jgi:acyl-CoA thioesterase-2
VAKGADRGISPRPAPSRAGPVGQSTWITSPLGTKVWSFTDHTPVLKPLGSLDQAGAGQTVLQLSSLLDRGHSRPAETVPPAEDLPPLADVAAAFGGLGPVWDGFLSVDVRLPNPPSSPPPERPDLLGTTRPAQPPDPVWMRVAGGLPDDPLVHAAGLLYLSDLMLISSSVAPHGYRLGHERAFDEQWIAVSLDHAVWFHQPARADEWLLFEQVSPVAGNGRALTHAAVFDATGAAVATVVQEALVTPRS